MAGVYRKGANKIFAGDIHWLTDAIMAQLVRNTYVPDYASHEFMAAAFPTTHKIGSPVQLEAPSIVNGAIDANDLLFPSVATTTNIVDGIVIYKAVGSPVNLATSPVLMYLDGKYPVIVAEPAATGATTLKVDRLPGSFADGTVLDFGGGITATLDGTSTAGSRSVQVDALADPVPVNSIAVPRVQNSGFPFTPNGTDYVYIFDDGPNRIVRL